MLLAISFLSRDATAQRERPYMLLWFVFCCVRP